MPNLMESAGIIEAITKRIQDALCARTCRPITTATIRGIQSSVSVFAIESDRRTIQLGKVIFSNKTGRVRFTKGRNSLVIMVDSVVTAMKEEGGQ